MIYSPGFTAPDGKTYRDLVPQVYYLTDKVEELLAGGGSEDGGGGIRTFVSYVFEGSFVQTGTAYEYVIELDDFTSPSVLYNTGGVNLDDYFISVVIEGNKLVFRTYTQPTGIYFSLRAFIFETANGTPIAERFMNQNDLSEYSTRYADTISIATTQWSGSGNDYSAYIFTSDIPFYYEHGLTLIIPVAKSKQICWNLGIYIAENQIMPGTAVTLKSSQIPPEKLDFYVYSIPIPDQTSATVALL